MTVLFLHKQKGNIKLQQNVEFCSDNLFFLLFLAKRFVKWVLIVLKIILRQTSQRHRRSK